MAPSANLQHLLLVGVNVPRQLVAAYDIATGNWSTPDIGGASSPSTPRQSLGITLDMLARRNVIFGGYAVEATRELDILDTSVGQWKWVSTAAATNMQSVLRPVMLYVPQIGVTLVMGGCSIQSVCLPFTNVYLIQFTDTGAPIVNSRAVTNADGAAPQPRMMPCVAVLNDGRVLMYGGMGNQEGYNDFWALNTTQWSWSQATIAGAPKQARAGATCFAGGMKGEKVFSDPQVAIIDMDSRMWTTKYTGSTSGLSLGAIVGISVGCSVVLCLLFFLLGRLVYKRHEDKKKHRHQSMASNVDSLSSLPLMDPTEGSLASTHLRDEPQSFSPSSTRSRSSLPLIITPYSPTTFSSPSSLDMSSTKSIKPSTRRAKDEEFPESERMTHFKADKQYSQYVKTQQHGKQYERRRQLEEQLQSGNTSLNRSGTRYTYKDDPEDGIELATSMIHLREIEVGEESIVTRLNGLETGAILVSGHLDASPSSNNHHNKGQQHDQRPVSISPLARTTLHLPRDYQGP
ncbi:hypothetical protein BGZ82_008534 [Podila clonocystis]|nr:hypothetical protein BGZ82_008534 [Podila clonocystis]